MKRFLCITLFLCSFVFLFTANLYAIPLDAHLTKSEAGLGDFTGSFDFSATNDTTATITVVLTNTSPAANGGFLTAFAFNNPSDLITGAALTTSSPASNFVLIGGPTYGGDFQDDVDGEPFGDFDIGASTDSVGGSWAGGGAPSLGLGVGVTGTFTFGVTGSGFLGLSTEDFAYELSEGGPKFAWFVARFRGFNDGESDKVPVVPEPTTMVISGLFLLGAGIFVRRKLHRKS
jgi:hypothetical protein